MSSFPIVPITCGNKIVVKLFTNQLVVLKYQTDKEDNIVMMRE